MKRKKAVRRRRYRAAKVKGSPALWRLLERRQTKKGWRYVCIAIGNPALREIAIHLNDIEALALPEDL